jgi:hypothetical protein
MNPVTGGQLHEKLRLAIVAADNVLTGQVLGRWGSF